MSTLLDRLKVTLRFTTKTISESEKNIQRMMVVKRFLEKQIRVEEGISTSQNAVAHNNSVVQEYKKKVKVKRDRGVFNYNGFETPIFTDILKAIFSDLSKKLSIEEMRKSLQSTAIIGADNPNRRLILTPAEFNDPSLDKTRFFNQVFTDKDGNQFYLFSEWGRYQDILRKGKKVRVEGNIYKLMRELSRINISLTQVGGTNYQDRS